MPLMFLPGDSVRDAQVVGIYAQPVQVNRKQVEILPPLSQNPPQRRDCLLPHSTNPRAQHMEGRFKSVCAQRCAGAGGAGAGGSTGRHVTGETLPPRGAAVAAAAAAAAAVFLAAVFPVVSAR
jgi:hypothetical protein